MHKFDNPIFNLIVKNKKAFPANLSYQVYFLHQPLIWVLFLLLIYKSVKINVEVIEESSYKVLLRT